MRSRPLALLYDSEFFRARLVTYAVVAGLFLVAMVAPIDYACAASGTPCPACGFRTAVWHLLHLEIAEALSASPLLPPVAALALLACADVVWGIAPGASRRPSPQGKPQLRKSNH